MQRSLGMGVVLAGVGAALVIFTRTLLQDPGIQVVIGMGAMFAGGVIIVFGARQRHDVACTDCGTPEDWGFAFCQGCGRQKA